MKKITLVVMFSAAMLAIIAAPAQSFGAPLDRAALIKLADDYFSALVAHNPKGVPLANNVRIVEQVKRIQPGEGLWKTTTSGPTDFKIVVPDTVAQQVGGIVILGVSGQPAFLGFRLKVENDNITEAEHIIVDINNPNTVTPARPTFAMEIPYEYRDSRGRLIWIAKSYYDALDWNNGSLAPFASDCERHENGMRSAPNGGPSLTMNFFPGAADAKPKSDAKPKANAKPKAGPGFAPSLLGLQDCAFQINTGAFQYVDIIDNRRVFAADELTGLAIGFSHFRHAMKDRKFKIVNVPGREESDMSSQEPFDLPAVHLYKIWGGQIHEIEALGFATGYNSPTGWE